MAQRIKKLEKEAAEKAAAMFNVTSMSQKELSAEALLVSDQKGSIVENMLKNKELEKQHEEEIAESKKLGLENAPIIESTTGEIIKGLQKDLEENQNRFVELSEEKEKIAKEKKELENKISDLIAEKDMLSKENSILSKKINELSSELNLNKTDLSRDIVDSKIQIEDLQNQIYIYEQNESNYKFEITKLKAEINNLETALAKKPEAKQRLDNALHSNVQQTPLPMFVPKEQARRSSLPNAARMNGYESWN